MNDNDPMVETSGMWDVGSAEQKEEALKRIMAEAWEVAGSGKMYLSGRSFCYAWVDARGKKELVDIIRFCQREVEAHRDINIDTRWSCTPFSYSKDDSIARLEITFRPTQGGTTKFAVFFHAADYLKTLREIEQQRSLLLYGEEPKTTNPTALERLPVLPLTFESHELKPLRKMVDAFH